MQWQCSINLDKMQNFRAIKNSTSNKTALYYILRHTGTRAHNVRKLHLFKQPIFSWSPCIRPKLIQENLEIGRVINRPTLCKQPHR